MSLPRDRLPQLYPWVQPGAPANPLFGLAAGNPVSPEDAYKGPASKFGTRSDPMVGRRVGGTITFGGGLGLYAGTEVVGGLGLSGDTACADHSTAWRTRILLELVPSIGDDRITLDDAHGHPHCPNDAGTQGAVP
jgi:Haem-degrading